MSLKEKMMENMLEKMSKEEKFEMMDKMMDKFFADMTSEDKQEMMQKMMPKMMGGGMPMMDMMKNMMYGNQGKGEKGFNPGSLTEIYRQISDKYSVKVFLELG